jgi:ATP-dependent Clp protease ATP-binding subunit ClpX
MPPTDKITLYGISFDRNKVMHIPGPILTDICRHLFLCIEIPPDQVKEIVHRLGNDPGLDYLELQKLLHQHLEDYRELLRIKKIQANVIRKIGDWIALFGPPDHAAIDEMMEIFDVDQVDVIKVMGLARNNRIRGPVEIKAILDPNVVGQETAKKSLSFAFYLHLLRTNILTPAINRLTGSPRLSHDKPLPKPVMVLIGPTGSGKTYIVNQLCKAFEVPFLRVDCASLVASGYVGTNLNDSLYQLLRGLNFDMDKASGAIIYFDEFDKISESQTGNKGSVGGVELQQEFLSLIENDEKVINPPKWGLSEPSHTLPLKNLMFIFSGSFAGMEPLIARRMNRSGNRIEGFRNHNREENNHLQWEPLLEATHQDLVDFGIIPELAGRVNFIVPLHKLTRENIIEILKNGGRSPLRDYENFFYVHYDELVVEDEVYGMMADEILKLNTDARGIQTILHKLLQDFLYECPDEEFQTYRLTRDLFCSKFPQK